MARYLVQSFMFVFLMVSCSPTIGYPTAIPPIAQNTVTPTATVTISMSAPTQTIMPTATEDKSCPERRGETPLRDIATGTILLNNTAMANTLFLLDLETGKEYKLPYQSKKSVEYNGPKVSPDGNMLAYPETLIDGENMTTMLWVLNAHANVLAKVPFNQLLYHLRWLDNERLVFYTHQTPKDGTVLVFNPFTRTRSLIANELPDFDTFLSSRPGQDWLAEYSSDLHWVVYLGVLDGQGSGPIIRDVIKDQMTWEPETKGGVGSFGHPVWSPDGKQVAVGMGTHFYIIDHDGHSISPPGLSEQASAFTFSWSPDGRYIAFWLFDSDSPQPYTLMTYDTQLNKVTNYCIEDAYPTAPVWSPNSQQIIVNINSDNGKPILVDIQKNLAYKLPNIPDVTYPLGWMNSLP